MLLKELSMAVHALRFHSDANQGGELALLADAIARELWARYASGPKLDYAAAERHLQRIVAHARSEARRLQIAGRSTNKGERKTSGNCSRYASPALWGGGAIGATPEVKSQSGEGIT